MTITKLDLGNTMWNDDCPIEEPGWTCIDLINDGQSGKVQGDYNVMPFASNSFETIHGSCYFEDTTNLTELHRVLQPGGYAYLTSCEEWDARNPEEVDEMFQEIVRLTRDISSSGLELVSIECRDIYEEHTVSYPLVTLRRDP